MYVHSFDLVYPKCDTGNYDERFLSSVGSSEAESEMRINGRVNLLQKCSQGEIANRVKKQKKKGKKLNEYRILRRQDIKELRLQLAFLTQQGTPWR